MNTTPRLLGIALLVVGCILEPVRPWEVQDAWLVNEIQPDSLYLQAWASAEACVGQTRPISEIRWYAVGDSITFDVPGVGRMTGLAEVWGYRVFLAGRNVQAKRLITHESVHMIALVLNHPDSLFGRCDLQ